MSERHATVPGEGDLPAAFLERLPDIEQKLVGAVRRCCPPWLAAQADDLVQAAMMKVVEHSRRNPASPEVTGAYLWRVAYSSVVDEIRRHRRRREVRLTGEADAAPEPATDAPGPDRHADSRAIGAAISDCLKGMLPERRQAVTLHLLGHTVPEIARLLGWNAKRAENSVYRGLSDLRSGLAERGITP
jgi:RNA polymerase sigma-70 factor, ECF subfamily